MFAEYYMMLQGWKIMSPGAWDKQILYLGYLVLLVIVEYVGLTKRKNLLLIDFHKRFCM